ncbi:amino acid permease [Neochlamydia sp. AcF95]|uniref:amino acid permease n=1 Tax=Neochlamydia sp. AcF95 TaxID=2795734 RepID=UPI001BC8D2DC|nr:amino acid permease [Neochlamydia sp. AcF95]MBS4170814.1 Uncharacterized protein [Neochlamydia sp. AcF95]
MTFLSTVRDTLFSREKVEEKEKGFGTFIGVFVPSILMLFGVIIFLRLGWIVGQVGLSTTLMIVTSAAFIALVTTLSMTSIATNIEIGKGGVYYILSRSLGIEIGAAIGLPLYVKQSLSIAFCVIGFAESLHDLIPQWSIVSISIATLIVLTALAYFSLSGALKIQVFIFVSLIASLISLFMGGGEFISPSPESFTPEPATSLGFWTIFAIFFPAMTGVEATVSLSGDLRKPERSLPLGTLSALLVAYVIYMLIPVFLVKNVSLELLSADPLIMQNIARIPSLIILGIWGATISSALGGLLGAPRMLQALAEDGVVPQIFARTFGKDKQPRIATLTTFCISFCGVYFGSVNVLAPLLAMICLICYGVLNFSAGFETLMANPSWRPRFRIHWSISMLGALLCVLTMLMIDAGAAIMAVALIILFYLIAKRRALSGAWDDMRYGILVFFSRFAIYRLAYSKSVAKSWRPHFLVFSKNTEGYSNNLLEFTQAISQSKGFLTMASFVPQELDNEKEKQELKRTIAEDLQKQNIQALVHIMHTPKITAGMTQMIKSYGLGPLQPNTLVFGGVADNEAQEFAQVMKEAYLKYFNVVILNENRSKDLLPLQDRKLAGDIHIWWDEKNIENSELMLILSYMLQTSPLWKKTRICLKGIVDNETLRKQEVEKFKQIGVSKRLPLDVEILVSDESRACFYPLVEEFSKNAGIVFISMRAPKIDESMEDYTAYLNEITLFSTNLPPTALVLGSKSTPLDNILK